MKYTAATLTFVTANQVMAFTPGRIEDRDCVGHQLASTAAAVSIPPPTDRPIYDPLGLYPMDSEERKNGCIRSLEKDLFQFSETATTTTNEKGRQRPLYDPLGLYPKNSPERLDGRIQPLEADVTSSIEYTNSLKILDPLSLYPSTEHTSSNQEKVKTSKALPFMPQPKHLSGEMAGDVGFDPFGFAVDSESSSSQSHSQNTKLAGMRIAEIKHSRIAMLAAVGWPLSELMNKDLAKIAHMKSLLVAGTNGLTERVPSVLNGGLEQVSPFYWGMILAAASAIEIYGLRLQGEVVSSSASEKTVGDLGFDPLNIYPINKDGQERMQLAEIKHGRVAMVATTVYALQEFFTKTSIVHEFPFLSNLLIHA